MTAQKPTADELDRAHRAFAVEYNNRAWALSEKTDRTDAENDDMLHMAHAAALTSIESPDWEIAFSHAILAHACGAAGRAAEHREHYAIARRLGDAIADAEDRAIFDATFRTVLAP